MPEFLLMAAVLIVIAVAAGLFGMRRAAGDTDLMMAVQVLGTGGGAVLLLLSVAVSNAALLDVALCLALLSAFAVAAFQSGLLRASAAERDAADGPEAP